MLSYNVEIMLSFYIDLATLFYIRIIPFCVKEDVFHYWGAKELKTDFPVLPTRTTSLSAPWTNHFTHYPQLVWERKSLNELLSSSWQNSGRKYFALEVGTRNDKRLLSEEGVTDIDVMQTHLQVSPFLKNSVRAENLLSGSSKSTAHTHSA